MTSFYDGLADILEVTTKDITPSLLLAAHAWDSLAVISCIALIDECFGVLVEGARLAKCRTVADLDALVFQVVPA